MRLYIAYKFSNIEDKSTLRDEINKVSDILEEKGHTTYILGRDLQKWTNFSHKLPHKMRTIVKQIHKAECIFAFINSPVFSKGLLFEMIISRILGKNIFMFVDSEVSPSVYGLFANKIAKYNNLDDLKNLDC